MPELPEVETVVQGIDKALLGSAISSVKTTRHAMRYPFPKNLSDITDATITAVHRRAKYILIDLSIGQTLLIHLGMSGRIRFAESHYAPQKHDHFLLTADNGKVMVFNDARRFGFVDLSPTDALQETRHLGHLGLEPFDPNLDGDTVFSLTHKARTPIKTFLLNQKNIVGIGNIYACEALFLSGIHPETPAQSLSREKAAQLLHNVQHILKKAIQSGGSSLRDYTLVDGSLGRFQFTFNVYDRENSPCTNPLCTGTVKRIIQSGRSTFYCPSCQKHA